MPKYPSGGEHAGSLSVDLAAEARSVLARPAEILLTAGDLSRGYRQTMAEHATGRHQAELTAYVAEVTGGTPGAAAVHDLTAAGLDLDWFDRRGGHRRRLAFDRPATTRADLSRSPAALLGLGVC